MSETELILIRHGQANNTAQTEAEYDRLSDLGHHQARLLGDHIRHTQMQYDRIYCGTLRRHRETAEAMQPVHDIIIDERLNEMRFFDMAQEYERQTGQPNPHGHAGFAQHLPKILTAWAAGDFDHVHVPYAEFATRFADVMNEARTKGGRSLFVTSGGVIGTAVAQHLGLSATESAKTMMPIRNTSLHVFNETYDQLHFVTYNATPHVDHADNLHARTFY